MPSSNGCVYVVLMGSPFEFERALAIDRCRLERCQLVKLPDWTQRGQVRWWRLRKACRCLSLGPVVVGGTHRRWPNDVRSKVVGGRFSFYRLMNIFIQGPCGNRLFSVAVVVCVGG